MEKVKTPQNCIYCGQPLDGSEEHILQEGIGGTLKSDKICCSVCNHLFGITIDEAVVNEHGFICNQLGISGKKRTDRKKCSIVSRA
jgi:hypothetical protein